MSLLTISGFRTGNLLLAFSSKAGGILARIRAFPFIRLPVRAFPFIRLPVSPNFRFFSSHLYICACEGTPSLSLWLRAVCFILVFRHRRCKQQASHGFASGRLAMNAPRGGHDRRGWPMTFYVGCDFAINCDWGGDFPTKEGDICLSSSAVLCSEFSARDTRSAPVVGDQHRTP
jgi:hypothetical protein